jgi:hypothetical protein
MCAAVGISNNLPNDCLCRKLSANLLSHQQVYSKMLPTGSSTIFERVEMLSTNLLYLLQVYCKSVAANPCNMI